MTDSDGLEGLSSAALHDLAVRRACRHLDGVRAEPHGAGEA